MYLYYYNLQEDWRVKSEIIKKKNRNINNNVPMEEKMQARWLDIKMSKHSKPFLVFTIGS